MFVIQEKNLSIHSSNNRNKNIVGKETIRKAVGTWKCSRDNENRILNERSIKEMKVSIEYNLKKLTLPIPSARVMKTGIIMNFAR